jgi:uncharacterized membrane protein YphA (DoxX/SURF4 family)
MNPANSSSLKASALALATVLARWFLGSFFIYMGLNKALHPVEFLKLVRQYDLVQNYLALNLIAGGLPWLEIFFGLLLLLGVAVRGSALILVGMLVPFTWVILHRALALHSLGGIAFCAIKFDCGCGTGEVFICWKLVENSLLILLSVALLFWGSQALCWRHSLIEGD